MHHTLARRRSTVVAASFPARHCDGKGIDEWVGIWAHRLNADQHDQGEEGVGLVHYALFLKLLNRVSNREE